MSNILNSAGRSCGTPRRTAGGRLQAGGRHRPEFNDHVPGMM
jgi:hypothetical protein